VNQHIAAAGDPSSDVSGRLALETNARTYLNAIWAYRRAAIVLSSGDTPAGFDTVCRNSMLGGFRRWMSVLGLGSSPRGQLLTHPHRRDGRGIRDGDHVRGSR
jgi:hypothetical protein